MTKTEAKLALKRRRHEVLSATLDCDLNNRSILIAATAWRYNISPHEAPVLDDVSDLSFFIHDTIMKNMGWAGTIVLEYQELIAENEDATNWHVKMSIMLTEMMKGEMAINQISHEEAIRLLREPLNTVGGEYLHMGLEEPTSDELDDMLKRMDTSNASN